MLKKDLAQHGDLAEKRDVDVWKCLRGLHGAGKGRAVAEGHSIGPKWHTLDGITERGTRSGGSQKRIARPSRPELNSIGEELHA